MENDIEELNQIRIPLADLRQQIVTMMREGSTDVRLGDYLHMLHSIYHESEGTIHPMPDLDKRE